MNNRSAYYRSMKGIKQEKILTFKFEKNREVDASCFDKKYFNKKKHKDDIVGYVHLKNKKYTGREFATLYGVDDKQIDIYAKKKIYERVVGYVITTDGEYLGVTKPALLIIILFGLALAALTVGLVFTLNSNQGKGNSEDQDNSVITPSGEIEEDPTYSDDQVNIVARLVLPEGSISFDGKLEGKDGSGSIKAVLKVDGKDHILIPKKEINIVDGKIEDTFIDFTELDFELEPGVYDGVITITYPDGTSEQLIIECFIVSASSGTIDVSYSDEVKVELSTGDISLLYSPSNASKDSTVQVILVDGENEYILAESIAISNNQKLVSLALNENMKSRLAQGTYNGIIRVYMDNGNTEGTAANIHTDIEVTISVYE